MRIKWEKSDTMGSNPASVEMSDGTIILNKDVFPHFNKLTQNFIIEHEKGHYLLQTDSEEASDRYALQRVYGKYRKSLKKSIEAVASFLSENDPRIKALYIEALKIDLSKNKNPKALKELQKLIGEQKTMKIKQSSMSTPFLSLGATEAPAVKETPVEPIPQPKPMSKTYAILGFDLNLTQILLIVSILVLIFKKS